MNANVGLFLHRWAARHPERTGIIDAGRGDLVLDYGELDRRASRVAAFLCAHGLGAGDRVAIYTDNGLGFVAAWFGAVYAGCTTLPLPATSTAREIAFRLEHAGCKALLTDSARADVAEEGRTRASIPVKVFDVREATDGSAGLAEPVNLLPDSLALLLYTSGTTGASKAVCITHQSLGAHTKALVEQTLRLGESDRILGALPLSHSYGIRMTLLVPFYAGASTVFVPRFSPTRTLELCERHRVTWLPGVPTMFVAWADEKSVPAPPALRWCLSAGAPLAEDVRLRAEQRLGAPVRQGYGLTEATFTAINAPPDEAVPGSSGKPVSGVEVRIADDAGRPLPVGSHGEVLIRGQNVMAGYLDDKLATLHVLRGGWLHTGDIGFVDEENRLTIVDRSKDLILRGGASIYPSEVENVLAHHPAVRDVAIVGQPDAYYGEEIVAVVVKREAPPVTAIELDRWVRERLASYKVPRRYAFVDALPQGASGKTLKRHLRDQLVAGEIRAEDLAPHRPAD
ncbi:MAG TPA: AMP-binding protein [Polyangiales bacterium]|nr:AMP-binding protein [Polyangiales bacterium]